MFRRKDRVEIKTPEQIALMRGAGLVVGRTLERLREAVAPCTPELASRVSGVPADSIRAAVDALCSQATFGPMLNTASANAASTFSGRPGTQRSTMSTARSMSALSRFRHSAKLYFLPLTTPPVCVDSDDLF